jgi:predicted amidohydrolase
MTEARLDARRDPTTVDVAVLQMAAVPGEVKSNVDKVVAAVGQQQDADLVVAPELATTGYDLDLLGRFGHELAEPLGGPSILRIAEAAVASRTTVVVGFLESSEGRLYDSLATIEPTGAIRRYRKTHLYPPELAVFAPGDVLTTVVTPAGVIGPLLCFEHAFPEIATSLALAGAQILVIPSAVPFGFEHLLELRTRARGQDNQVYAIGCNLVGHGFCGHSLVADPRGEVVTAADVEETVLRARLDMTAVARERQKEPALRLRRPDLYARPPSEG